jgi:hypothetical protein
MSVYKPFTTADLIVTPFEVNKSFSFKGEDFINSNIGIEKYIGTNIQDALWVSGSNNTGQLILNNQQLVYNSIKQLYYSNYLLSPSGSPASTASFTPTPFIPDFETAISRNVLTGKGNTTNYYNYLSSTININRTFPTESNAKIGVISIPSNLFGEYLKPGSFTINTKSGSITDDTEGNLLYNSSGYSASKVHVGNIIYEHGMSIIISKSMGSYGDEFFNMFNSSSFLTCSFQSNITIFESQYKCTARPDEFLFSQNPSLLSGSNPCPKNITSTLYDFATGSYFTPYVTTVGLYNNNKELVAVGKLAQPLDMSDTTDTTILINLDL